MSDSYYAYYFYKRNMNMVTKAHTPGENAVKSESTLPHTTHGQSLLTTSVTWQLLLKPLYSSAAMPVALLLRASGHAEAMNWVLLSEKSLVSIQVKSADIWGSPMD